MKIYLAGDHAGFELKNLASNMLKENGHEIVDFGATSFQPNDDYPDFVTQVANAIASDLATNNSSQSLGFIFGGSGQGEAMATNRVSGVRTAVFYGPVAPNQAIDVHGELSTDPYSIVRLEREHNNANILSIGARFVTHNEAMDAIKIFLGTPFSNDERHVRRIAKF